MRNPTVLLITLGYSFCVVGAGAQLVSVGVKGGLPINTVNSFNDESRRYIVGPSIEFRLPFHFAAEVDALYSRVGNSFSYSYTDTQTGTTTSSSGRQRGNSWEFPVLGKYYFGARKVQPFLGTGYSFRSIWTHSAYVTSVLSGSPIPPRTTVSSFDGRETVNIGAIFTGGVRMRAGRFSVLPELRYTRHSLRTAFTPRGEGKFLLGISF